jgi:transposase
LGRSRGGFSCKIHLAADALGLPLRLRLTAGQSHDSTQAQALMDDLAWDHAIADRAYAGQPFIDGLIARGILPVFPPHQRAKLVREYDQWLYRERHLVECLVNKFKHFRRIFSRFDKLASRYLGFLHFVGALLWLR